MAQHSLCKFSVVYFPQEKSVAAVPTTWLREEKGRFVCKWPKGPNATNFVKDSNSIPGKGWSSFPVKIYKELGSGEQNINANKRTAKLLL